ncbi:MAG: transferrin receptor-like dimerization domain-containing protein, partial [Caulobacteraceae bacterium]
AEVTDPETGVSVLARSAAALQVEALAPGATEEMKARAKKAAAGGDLPVADLGSGSDYSSFVQHLGIAALNIAYEGEGQSGGVYHSAYDTFEHYDRFGDPGMVYGVVLAKTGGRLALRAADADILPFEFGDFADTVGDQVAELKKLLVTEREHAVTVDKLLDQKAFALAADPTLSNGPPDREAQVPALDFTPLDTALTRLKASAAAYDQAAAGAVTLSPDRLAKANAILQGVEQAMTDERGLPGRPWYRHLIYAPGLLTGYGAKTLPGVREAIEGRRWAEATDYIGRTAAVLDAVSGRLDAARGVLGGG